MTVQFRSRIPSVIDYATEIKSVGVCCFLQDDVMNKVQSTQIECYALKGNFQFGNIDEISCDTVAETGCCCSCSEASKHEDYEAFLDANMPVDVNCTSGPTNPNAWGNGIGLKSNITKCQCDKVGGKWTAGDCPATFNTDVFAEDGVRSRCYRTEDPIIPIEYLYYCTASGLCDRCVSSECDMSSGIDYYDNQDQCDEQCVDPLRWRCIQGRCYSANDLAFEFASEAECQAACPRYKCNYVTGNCDIIYTDPTGSNGSDPTLLQCRNYCEREGLCCRTVAPQGCGGGSCNISSESACKNIITGSCNTFAEFISFPISGGTIVSCTQLADKNPDSPCINTAYGTCCGYGGTDPIDVNNCGIVREWDCRESGGTGWLAGTGLCSSFCGGLVREWICVDGECIGDYFQEGTGYANYDACIAAAQCPRYICVDGNVIPIFSTDIRWKNAYRTESGAASQCDSIRGRCCDPNGGCTDTTEVDCGGLVPGLGLVSWTAVTDGSNICSPNLCPQPTGSCCYINQTTGDRICATDITEIQCAAFGDSEYIFRPNSSTCISCNPFLGKCCKSYQCTDEETRIECEDNAAGVWTKFGSCSETLPCGTDPNPEGRCCINGACSRSKSVLCLNAGGVWTNTPDSCSPNPCITQTERCCYIDGTCTDSTVEDCLNAGGANSGVGTSCSNGTCESAITCCTTCNKSQKTATSCFAGGGFTISNSNEPCCVQCCYNQEKENPTCEYLTSNARESATTRCLGLGGTIIDQTACSTCNAWKFGCVDGTCKRIPEGTFSQIVKCGNDCYTGSCCYSNGTCVEDVTKAQCPSPKTHTVDGSCDDCESSDPVVTCCARGSFCTSVRQSEADTSCPKTYDLLGAVIQDWYETPPCLPGSPQWCGTLYPVGGCCKIGQACFNSYETSCLDGDWSNTVCQTPPQYCGDDIIVDPCENLPISTICDCGGKRTVVECRECCNNPDPPCGAVCCSALNCVPWVGPGPLDAVDFPGRSSIIPEAACQIDVRIPRSCCYIQYDPTFGAIGMTCNNVCSSAECEKLKVISNSQHPAVYTRNAICPPRKLSTDGEVHDCNDNTPLALTNKSFYSDVPFGTCWTLGITTEYTCDITDESTCGSSNGYWVSLKTSDGQMCDSTYRPQPINISTTRILEPETMNASEFQSLGLEFGDFYKGGYYIGIYSPGVPLTQSASSLYGSLNFTMPKVNPSNAIGRGGITTTKWALIVEPYTFKSSFLNTIESSILLPHTKLSKYDGFYNCYGDGVFGGLRSSLTNSVIGRNRRGFPDYYLPSIQELMFLAYQINDFSTDNYMKYISIFKNDQGINKPTYLSSSSINDNLLYSQYLQPMDTDSFGRIFTSKLKSINTVKFFRRINLT